MIKLENCSTGFRWIFILIIVSVSFALAGCSQTLPNNSQIPVVHKYATSVDDVKIEFIPAYVTNLECKVTDQNCVVYFQIKNDGDNYISLKAGTAEGYNPKYENNSYNWKGFYYYPIDKNQIILAPNETSSAIRVVVSAEANVDAGEYNLEIPIQLWNYESAQQIGELSQHLPIKIYINNTHVAKNVVIYENSGEIKQSETDAILKGTVNNDGSSFSTNMYQGGDIQMNFQASNNINYVLLAGDNCTMEEPGTSILSKGSIQNGVVSWKRSAVLGTVNLCLKIINPNFIDWNNINPINYSVSITETQYTN